MRRYIAAELYRRGHEMIEEEGHIGRDAELILAASDEIYILQERLAELGCQPRNAVVPEPMYFGLLAWVWRRITGYRDEYGRKAALIWPWE